MAAVPYIPSTITVHIGRPESSGENVTVTFPEYIKNVASSEIYPTWPYEAILANIYAQISYALNRIYTEYYRSQGYDFDITNSTALDQSFIPGRNTFETINQIVDEVFNDYVKRIGNVEPLATKYCNGTTTVCDGLTQWGTVDLANQGYTALEILKYYYGDDIEIVEDAPIEDIGESYPNVLLSLGISSNYGRYIQVRLNRISVNYPSIPKITYPDGVFGIETENAVKAFQREFSLVEDGIVGKATWYRILYIYNAVKKVSELISEGIQYEDVELQFRENLKLGDTGEDVRSMKVILSLIGEYVETVRPVPINEVFDELTQAAVEDFQRTYGLEVDGIVDVITWDNMIDVYIGIIETISPEQFEDVAPFPGVVLKIGSEGENVRKLQTYLDVLANAYPEIQPVEVNGIYDEATRQSVISAQKFFGITPTGFVGPLTWTEIAREYATIVTGELRSLGQF